MTKRTAISLPLLSILGFFLCVITFGIGFLLISFGLLAGPTVAGIVYGLPEHMTDPEAYARRRVAILEDVDEEIVQIVQTQSLGNPQNLWAVLTRTQVDDLVEIRLYSFYMLAEGEALHINSGFDEIVQNGTYFDATAQRYSNNIGYQFSVHGTIYNEEVTQILVSGPNEWQDTADIEDNTFLLFAERPFWPFSINDLKVTGLNQAGDVISELTFPEP